MQNLVATPNALDFGDVTTGTTAVLSINLFNDSIFNDATIVSISTDNGDFVPGTFTTPIAPQDSVDVEITYTAGAAGPSTGTITIVTNAANNPITIAVTANSIAAGSKALSISPSSWVFDPTKVAQDSATKTFRVTNTGTVATTVQIPVLTAPFIGVGLPAGVTVLNAGDFFEFDAKFHPTVAGYQTDPFGIVITSDAISSPNNIDLEGLAVLITPAYVVVGGTENGFAAFGPTLKKFNATDFNCEDTAYAERVHSFLGPGYEATLERLEIQYEDYGAARVEVKITNERDQTTRDNLVVGTVAATKKLRNNVANVTLPGELMTVRITPTGPFWMTAYIARYSKAGEVKGS